MKKLLLLLSLSFCLLSVAHSQLPIKDGTIIYEDVIVVENTSKDVLYDRIFEWFSKTYKSSNDVIQVKDKEAGKIIGKGIMDINYYQRKPSISHTISVYIKDNRFKYVIDGLSYKDVQGDSFLLTEFPKGWAGKKKLYETVDSNIKTLINSLKEASSKKSDVEEDW